MTQNVLILSHSYGPQFLDISNQYTHIFEQQQYTVTVAYLTGPPSHTIKEQSLAQDIIFFDFPKSSLRYLKLHAIKQILQLCREKQFQIVVCHRYKPSYILMWVAQFLRVPAVVFVMHELKTMVSIKRRLLIKALWRKNMLFAGVSNAVRDDMRRSLWFLPKQRVVTLYNMIDVPLTQKAYFEPAEARRLLNLPEQGFIFGNLGRLVKNKDHNTLIDAFNEIHAQCPNASLVILGSGDLHQPLSDKITQLNLSDKVFLLGFVEQGFRYMQAFDCFVMSSIQEAFGRVLLEAMIAKLPVIATRVHGMPEVMGDVGKVVPAKNAPELAKAMLDIYQSSIETRQQVGELAYDRAEEHFSLPTFEQQFFGMEWLQKALS